MDRYSKWLIGSLMAIAVFVAVYLAVCHFYFRTPQFSLWIHNCMVKKIAYARSIETRKIVLLAGSNTLFGTSAATIEAETGIRCVNLAVHYGLQIDYMTENAKGVLRRGDIVVMPLEYHHYSYDGGYSLVQSAYIRTYDRAYYERLPLARKMRHLINTTPIDLYKSISEQANFAGVETPAGRGVYNSGNLNVNGDDISVTEPMYDRLDREQPVPIRSISAENYGFATLIDFAGWCRENGVTLFVTWPNTMWFPQYTEKRYVDYFARIEAVCRKNGIIWLGERKDSFFDKRDMYDGFYHLNSHGIKLRSALLVQALKEKAGQL